MCSLCGQALSCEGSASFTQKGFTQGSYKDAGGLLLSRSVCTACLDLFTTPQGLPGHSRTLVPEKPGKPIRWHLGSCGPCSLQ